MSDTENLFEDIFGDISVPTSITNVNTEEVPVNQLHEFKNHPFKVIKDRNFLSLTESIMKYGIMEPIIARKRAQGTGYEIISGHRRWTAAKDLKLGNVPVKIVDVDDCLATIMMVDSNKKRDKYFPSELAFAFKQRVEAEEKYTRNCGGGRVTERIGKDFGMSPRNVSNYIKLTDLIPDLLELVDDKKLKKNAAVIIADMDKDRQSMIYSEYVTTGLLPNVEAANELASYDIVDSADVHNACLSDKPKSKNDPFSEFETYFPTDWKKEDKVGLIKELLEDWSKSNKGLLI